MFSAETTIMSSPEHNKTVKNCFCKLNQKISVQFYGEEASQLVFNIKLHVQVGSG